MKKILLYLFIFISTIALIGCGQPERKMANAGKQWNGNLINVSYYIVEKLENNLKAPISTEDTIIVATFADVNNLKTSTSFGRVMAEQISSRLAQKGYKVIEMKLRQNSLFIEERNGEFLLSRDIKSISDSHNASAVVVGTYGQSGGRIYVSTRIINPENSVILSACDSSIPVKSARQMYSFMKD